MKPLGWDRLSLSQKLLIYGRTRQPILNRDGLFSDGTGAYRIPSEPDPHEGVTIKLRTRKNNVDEAYLIYKDVRVKMSITSTDNLFDYYEGIMLLEDAPVAYYFELHAGLFTCFYNKQGVMREANPYFHYRITPGFKTPDWAKGAVYYQIFVDRFYNGDPTNDVVDGEYSYVGGLSRKIKDWDAYPDPDSVRDFYGGDLQGIMDKLDYIEGLGVEVIYLNPVFVSPSNHKYDTQDYDYVDPHFGCIIHDGGEALSGDQLVNKEAKRYITRTANKENLEASNALLGKLIEEVHARGMRLILDGVFNHCGSFNKWLDRERLYHGQEGYDPGAYTIKESPYQTFFHFQEEDNWPDNGNYDGWWGYDTLPKLNYEGSPILYDYIMGIGKKWVGPPYHADGWRLDVAADLGYTKDFNHQFWRDFRRAVKSANKDAIILAEHYEDARDWLTGDQWDTIMNYDAFMEPVTWFLTGLEKHSDEYKEELLNNHGAFFECMTNHMQSFLIGSQLTSMNELSNHDHSRFLTRTNHQVGRTGTHGAEKANEGINKGIMKEAVVIQMTWPGAPTIYYGDEVGVCGWTDPDNRRTYPWGREDTELLGTHQALIHIHKSYQALRIGSLKYLYGEYGIIGYGRFYEQERIVVAVNNNNEPKTILIPVWQIGVEDGSTMKRLILTTQGDHSTEPVSYHVKHGKIELSLMEYSGIILLESGKKE